MLYFRYILVIIVFVVIGCERKEPPNKPGLMTKNSRDLSHEKWLNEKVDLDSLKIKGLNFNGEKTLLNKMFGIPDSINNSNLIFFHTELENLNSNPFISTRFYQGYEFYVNELSYIIKSVNFRAESDAIVVDGKKITKNTSSVELMEMFPESFKLIDYGTWYQWAGVVRIRTSDRYVYLDLEIASGKINKIHFLYY